MRSDADFQFLFTGSPVVVVLAELFFRAEGFRVYATRFDPMASIISTRWDLYVAREDHREALAVLVFLGFMDRFYDMNAMSILLGRDLHDLLPADRLASIQKLAAHLQMQEAEQTVVVIGVYLTMVVASGVFESGAGVLIALVIALLEMILFWRSDKVQRVLRSRLRAEALPRAEDVVELAQRKLCRYAVFLRNFGVLREFLVGPHMNPGLVVDPYELRIVEAIRYGACMPVVTLTDPKIAKTPVVGACRFAPRLDHEWQEFTREILNGASLIVVHLREMAQGLQSEVEMIQNGGLMTRTIFVMDQAGEKAPTPIPLPLVEATNTGARVLRRAVLEEWGLPEFIDAVEDILGIYTESGRGTLEADSLDDRNFCTNCGGVLRPNADFCIHCRKRVFELLQDLESAVLLDYAGTEETQDSQPKATATCPVCGHTWMGSWHVSFKDRQCPQCGRRWMELLDSN